MCFGRVFAQTRPAGARLCVRRVRVFVMLCLARPGRAAKRTAAGRAKGFRFCFQLASERCLLATDVFGQSLHVAN